jgi:hypothetical protein
MGIPFEDKKRFRVNPIEIAIFAVIAMICLKSGYSLLYSHDGFDPVALTANAEDPSTSAQTRAPASTGAATQAAVTKSFTEVKIGCEPDKTGQAVSAHKIRLIGSLCAGSENTSEETPLNVKKINVVNSSAKVAATVFPDYSNRKFSTDYISLAQGKNVFYVQYEFNDGKTLDREYDIENN